MKTKAIRKALWSPLVKLSRVVYSVIKAKTLYVRSVIKALTTLTNTYLPIVR